MLNVAEELPLDNASFEKSPAFKLVSTKKIAYSEWLSIADCPFQRNTAERAKSADHLKNFDDSHRRVALAVLPNGDRYKVDGHTRAFVWSKGLANGVPSPLTLTADIYKCAGRDRETLGALYDRFDSRNSVQTTADITHSAANELNLAFSSPMLQRDRYAGALKRLYNITNGYSDGRAGDAKFTYTVIHYFSEELRLFDSSHPKHNDYNCALVMAAILTFMRYGKLAVPFWVKYGENAGFKSDAGVDGVQAMRNLHGAIRQKRQNGTAHDIENLGRAVNAFERYRERDLYTSKSGIPYPKDRQELDRYIQSAVKIKDGRR